MLLKIKFIVVRERRDFNEGDETRRTKMRDFD